MGGDVIAVLQLHYLRDDDGTCGQIFFEWVTSLNPYLKHGQNKNRYILKRSLSIFQMKLNTNYIHNKIILKLVLITVIYLSQCKINLWNLYIYNTILIRDHILLKISLSCYRWSVLYCYFRQTSILKLKEYVYIDNIMVNF